MELPDLPDLPDLLDLPALSALIQPLRGRKVQPVPKAHPALTPPLRDPPVPKAHPALTPPLRDPPVPNTENRMVTIIKKHCDYTVLL